MNRIVALTLAAGLLAAACSSSGGSQQPSLPAGAAGGTVSSASAAAVPVPSPIQGCVPVCNPPGITRPGSIPERPYKTQWFFGGQMVITPSEPWSIHEDSTGEFALTLDAAPQNSVLFWEDVYPTKHDKRVPGVSMTVKGLLGWLRKSPRLDVSAPHQGKIGSGLPATVVDVTVAKDAKNEDPGCPSAGACVLWLGFPQWDGTWGIADPQIQRFYLSDVSYGGKKHMFVAVVYPDNPADMKEFMSHAKDLMATVQVPATSA